MDQPLAVQFLTAGGLVALVSGVSLVVLFSQVDAQTAASRSLSQTHRAIGSVNTLGRDFYRQETALLEFLRTRDTRYLGNVHEQRQLWAEGFRDIDELIGNGVADERNLVNGLGAGYQAWIKVVDDLIAQVNHPLWSAGARPDPLQATSAEIRSRAKGAKGGRGARTASIPSPAVPPSPRSDTLSREAALFKESYALIDRLAALESRQLVLRDEAEKSATRATFTTITLILVALLALFGIVLGKLYLWVANPLALLTSGMRRYDAGDFGARVPVSNLSEVGYLQKAFNEMAEKIEFMVDDLRKLDQLKTEFVSTVSHELRTPLTSIGGYAKLLASGDAGPVTDTQREFLYIIDTNVVRLTHLINDILDVEKMESGKVQIVREPQDLASVLRECRDTFGILAAQKGLELRFAVPESLPSVLGDRGRLVQIFMNLLSNAIKYTERGFVEIVAETRDFAVTVRVRDSGVGVTAEEKEKIFQKFYRTRAGLRSSEGGTGLGLAIVRGLVDAHGGKVAVESRPGEGTVFAVTLPATGSLPELDSIVQLEPESSGDDADAVSAWQRPIWVVDSDTDAIQQMRKSIEDAGPLFKGYRLGVRVFGSLAEIPSTVSSEEMPFMVILDPASEQDTHGAIPWLRKRLHRTVPILVVSGSVDTAEVFAEGASALLTKPIDEREFLIAVKDLISAKGWRVLVAERSMDLRILLKRALEQRGFLVDDVDRGSQVMSRLEQEEYDLALVDFGFTDVPGRELLKVIRRGRAADELPVFVLYNEDKNPPTAEELAAWGASASMGKSKGIGGIVDTVCQYLEDRKLDEQPN